MDLMTMLVVLAFITVSVVMILLILVQRPQGGGLAGAFGGAGGGGTDTVFGGRVGDALTWATVVAFVLYLLLAIGLNRLETGGAPAVQPTAAEIGTDTDADFQDVPPAPVEDTTPGVFTGDPVEPVAPASDGGG